MDRRQILGGALAGLATALPAWQASAAAPARWFERRHVPIGLQLYTVAQALRDDLDGTLSKVAGIGYRTLELAGYHGHSVRALREAANRHTLKATSIHVNALATRGEPGLDQDIPRLAADLQVLGVTDVVMPTFPAPPRGAAMTRNDWLAVAALLNDRGAKLRREGLRLSYHNHNQEFAPVGGATGLDLLLAETSPADVAFQLDVGWAVAAGVDPVELLLRPGRRFQLMHVKDIQPGTRPNFNLQQQPAEVGSGSIEWSRILPVAFASGVRKFYVEQEPPFADNDRFAAIEKSYRFLKEFDA